MILPNIISRQRRHEETKRPDSRPHRQHPHLPGGRGGRVRDPGVQAGEESQEEARRPKVRTHAQIQLDQRELRGAGARRAAAQTSQSRGPVEVRRLLLLRHHCDYDDRLRPRSAQHRLRESVLHVLRPPGDPAHPGHVPEPGGADQHVRQVPAAPSQEVPGPASDRGLHGKHGDSGLLLLHEHAVRGGRGVLPLRGMELPPRLLLLLHNAHHHRLRRLRGSAEGQRAAERPSLRGLLLRLHPHGPDGDRSLPQPGGASLPDHEHRGRVEGRQAEGLGVRQQAPRRGGSPAASFSLDLFHARRGRRRKDKRFERCLH